jgi:hypothetical protein
LFGGNFEYFKSSNLFFPASNGFIFLTLLQISMLQQMSLCLKRSSFCDNISARTQFRYSALPGAAEPLQIYKSNKLDLYTQDEIKFSDRFKMTMVYVLLEFGLQTLL